MIPRIISLLSIAFIGCQVPFGRTFTVDDAMQYLLQFGYMQEYDSSSSSISHEDAFTEGIRRFQEMASLEVTGKLNSDTIRMMKMPRCGVKDVRNSKPIEHSLFRSYKLNAEGSKWNESILTYRITKYPSRLEVYDTNREIQRAFEEWSKVTPLTFIPKANGKADIEISFESGYHGDRYPFDRQGQILGHASFPDGGGDIHFNDDQIWTIRVSRQGVNLFQAAVHEIGHALGLDHSKEPDAIMFETYNNSNIRFELHQDDINGIQALYGRKEKLVCGKTGNDLCKDGKLDAIFTSSHGYIYLLKGSSYWLIDIGGLAPGYPKPISEKWIGLPSDIDAAFVGLYGKTYFFKGSQYWSYSDDGTLDGGYPKTIREGFGDIPSNIDAAMWAHHLNQGFFFKGDKYWVSELDGYGRATVKSSYPKLITNFKGIPSNLDDVLFAWKTIYFFKNGEFLYYRNDYYPLEYQKCDMEPYRGNAQISLYRCT